MIGNTIVLVTQIEGFHMLEFSLYRSLMLVFFYSMLCIHNFLNSSCQIAIMSQDARSAFFPLNTEHRNSGSNKGDQHTPRPQKTTFCIIIFVVVELSMLIYGSFTSSRTTTCCVSCIRHHTLCKTPSHNFISWELLSKKIYWK